MILSAAVNTSALTSGTTSFLVGSIRQADELSTTVVPASEDAQVRYEALFQHFWVDRMISGPERAALEQAAAQLGLSIEQARAIEARAAARDISK